MPATRGNGWMPKEGLKPRYDCPECAYERCSVTTSHHGFKRQLVTEHEHTMAEARRVVRGPER